MPVLLRRFAPVLLVAGLGLVAGCGASNNKGKIEGRWKFASVPGVDEAMVKQLEAEKVYLFVEFESNGTMTMGATSGDKAVLDRLNKSGEKLTMSCKYKLLSGDDVEFYDLPKEMQEKGGGMFGRNKDRARTKVKISGDNLTMTDPDGKTGSFTRVK